jgi:hypothetical protein
MVKITGFSSGGKHIAAHLKYISRDTDLPLENDRGEIFTDKKEIEGVINDWVVVGIGLLAPHKNAYRSLALGLFLALCFAY